MDTPKQMQSFWDNVIYASASDTVLKKLTSTILRRGNTRISEPGNLERLLSLIDRLLMDHLLTPLLFSSTSLKKLLWNRDILLNVWETFMLVSFW